MAGDSHSLVPGSRTVTHPLLFAVPGQNRPACKVPVIACSETCSDLHIGIADAVTQAGKRALRPESRSPESVLRGKPPFRPRFKNRKFAPAYSGRAEFPCLVRQSMCQATRPARRPVLPRCAHKSNASWNENFIQHCKMQEAVAQADRIFPRRIDAAPACFPRGGSRATLRRRVCVRSPGGVGRNRTGRKNRCLEPRRAGMALAICDCNCQRGRIGC